MGALARGLMNTGDPACGQSATEVRDTGTPGRQALINRVSQVVRRLSLQGQVVMASGASYENRKTCRWALADEAA